MKHSQYLTYNEEVVNVLTNVYLSGDFTDRESLDNCFQALMSYQQQLENKDQSMHIYYSICFQNSLRKKDNYENIAGDSYGYLDELDDDKYQTMLLKYYRYALSFQLEDHIKEMTEMN